MATVISAVVPFVGWTDKIREFRNLHFAYSQLFGQIDFVITEIRRATTLTDEHIGMSRMVHEAFNRMHVFDEPELDQELIDREDKRVREAFPEDYIWKRY